MFAARGNARALDRARRCGRHVSVLALCAVGIGVGMATPAQADRIGDARAQANQVWSQIQDNGVQLEKVIERYNGAQYRLQQTMKRIHENDIRLAAARSNLTHARHALNVSIISAYKHPQPDPLQAALEARNFGQVLEQFALLDRANSYNSSILTDIRQYRKQVDQSQRTLNRERNARRDNVAELASLKSQIDSSIAAEKRRYSGLKLKVRRLIDQKRAAEKAASLAAAAATRQLQAQSTAPAAVATVVGAPAAADAGPTATATAPPPSTLGEAAVSMALKELGTPYVWGGAAPGGFDCSGLVSWAYAQAGLGGLPHFTGALWASGTHISQGELAPGDLVFYNGLNHVGMYIGGGNFVEAPHTGDVVKISSMAARSGFVGAVRVTG
ncbi:MAG: peptidoglycan DL-endopeptidase CwlO [Gaiellales bacterium]|jgi:cell wall-associated NlpC family hydrolase|nr:peptidoglycan DL-endopeptidase CwlO [Gaiellales bacterium]